VPGQSLTAEEKLVVAALMGNILHKNFQRPGAAAQATFQEFNSMEKVNEGGEEVRVMRVARHKTARKGPAYLTDGKRPQDVEKVSQKGLAPP